jgi:hypothetical protein
MVRYYLAFAAIAVISMPYRIAAAQESDSWNNLKQLSHHATFTFTEKDRNCAIGFVKSVADMSVTVKLKDGKMMTIQRPDLLRVTRNWYGGPMLFSGRSSWSDVTALAKYLQQLHPRVIVETKAEPKEEGTLIGASNEGLTLQSHDKTMDVRKSEVVRVTNIVPKPVSDSAAYADDELVLFKVFDPELWPALFGMQGSINVPLFDVSLPEDNSQVTCREKQ